MSERRVRRSGDVIFRVTGDRVILRRVGDRGNGFELAGGAAVIWVLLDREAAADVLVGQLEGVGVDAADCDAALALLSDERLVQWA